MKLLITTLAALLLAAVVFATDITPRSVVALRTPDGRTYCTGFVIDNVRKYVVTADHCIDAFPHPFINGQQSNEIFHDPDLDVAVLNAPGVNAEAFAPADATPFYGSDLTSAGYANGGDLKIMQHKVMLRALSVEEISGRWVAYSTAVIMGMSGGPVLNAEGKVVAVVQLTDQDNNYSVSRMIEDVYPVTAEYWEIKQ